MRPSGIRRRAVTLAVFVAGSVILGVPPELAGPPHEASAAIALPSVALLGAVVATGLERSVDRAAAKRPGAGALGMVPAAADGSAPGGVVFAGPERFAPGPSPLVAAARAPPLGRPAERWRRQQLPGPVG